VLKLSVHDLLYLEVDLTATGLSGG